MKTFLHIQRYTIPTLLLILFLFSSGTAQELRRNTEDDNKWRVSSSVGFINPENFAFSIFGFSGQGKPSPSINIELDYAVNKDFTIGPYLTYYRVDAEYADNLVDIFTDLNTSNIDELLDNIGCFLFGDCGQGSVTERTNAFVLGGRLTYRKNIIPELDTYVSTSGGYAFNSRQTITTEVLNQFSTELGLNAQVPSFVYYTAVGARYAVNEKWGLYGELGYGNIHLIKTGLYYSF